MLLYKRMTCCRVSIYVSAPFRVTLIKPMQNTELDFTLYLTYAGNSTEWSFYPLNDFGITPYGVMPIW